MHLFSAFEVGSAMDTRRHGAGHQGVCRGIVRALLAKGPFALHRLEGSRIAKLEERGGTMSALEAANAYLDAWNARWTDAVLASLADDGRCQNPIT